MRTKTLQRESKEPTAKARQQSSPPMQQSVGMVASLLSLQRSHGNRFVQRLLRSGAIQAKLSISEPGDEYEREADQVADQVMRMAEPEVSAQDLEQGENGAPEIQRKCAACEEEEQVQRQAGEESLPGEASTEAGAGMSAELESGIGVLRGRGQPLPESARDYFEPRFGYDFGEVRVHSGGRAAALARAVSARAFTYGGDIVFAPGEYATETPAGRRLLAHELVHVVQQTPGAMMRKAVPRTHRTIPQIIQRVCSGGKKETANAILSDKEEDYRKAVRAGKYCKDTGFTGIFHEGRCYREVPPTRGFPGGDQVCFDDAGKCTENSPDVVSAVNGLNRDGTCAIEKIPNPVTRGGQRTGGHIIGDICREDPKLCGQIYGSALGIEMGIAFPHGIDSRLGKVAIPAILGFLGGELGKRGLPLLNGFARKHGFQPTISLGLGLGSDPAVGLGVGIEKGDPLPRIPVNTYLTLGIDSSLTDDPGARSTFLAKVGVRIDPGKKGGLFAVGSLGAGVAVGSEVSGATAAEFGAGFRVTEFLDVQLVRETVSGAGERGDTYWLTMRLVEPQRGHR